MKTKTKKLKVGKEVVVYSNDFFEVTTVIDVKNNIATLNNGMKVSTDFVKEEPLKNVLGNKQCYYAKSSIGQRLIMVNKLKKKVDSLDKLLGSEKASSIEDLSVEKLQELDILLDDIIEKVFNFAKSIKYRPYEE